MEDVEHKFPAFPYKPYSIQIDFMNALYRSLDKGGVSMLESPTGTGKTLSIICSALQWLVNKREQLKTETRAQCNQNGAGGSDDEPDWMRDFVVDKANQEPEKKNGKNNKSVYGLHKIDKRSKESTRDFTLRGGEEEKISKSKKNEESRKKSDHSEVDEEEFLVEEYESEDEDNVNGGKSKRKAHGVSIGSSSDEDDEKDGDDKEEDEEKLKIYFCSRTHSQLSQFVKELRKTSFASEITVVSLGSRKNFCINEEVLKLKSLSRVNERCLELQKKKKNDVSKTKSLGPAGRKHRTKVSSGCPMLMKHKLQKQFRTEVSQHDALDIEDLVRLGSSIGTCPYYGSRSMVSVADLVILPYQSLLSKSSRESLGLNLKNNIIIIDEAHNLADSLISMYDSKISLSQLEHVHSHTERYLERFRDLLGPGNRRYIQTLMVLTRAFIQAISSGKDVTSAYPSLDTEDVSRTKTTIDSSMAINDFLFSLNIDNINLVKLLNFIKESKINYKVSGYGDKMANSQKGLRLNDGSESSEEESSLSGFQALVNMVVSLTNSDGDGRVIISPNRHASSGNEGGFIKYVMLTGEKIFSEVMDQAHAVILAGGTLQPIEETKERLFPCIPPDQLHFFSCGHIVPPESIMPIAVSRGPSGHSFDFSFNSRSSSIMIEELGLLLCNLVTVIPEGIIMFFSSFDYEGQVYESWNAAGILDRIRKKKRVLREPRKNSEIDTVLKNYKEAIEDQSSQTGAILLAVVGGKISEGINFNDGMARCIVMVGLPYPSPSDIELIERIKHIENLGGSNSKNPPKLSVSDNHYNGDVRSGFDLLRSCKRRGKDYYDNLCMKAVNQSIGRAIRHINDYAAILLVDARYSSESSKRSFSHPTNKLPLWIKDRLVSSTNNYGEVHRLLHQFFKLNKQRSLCQQ